MRTTSHSDNEETTLSSRIASAPKLHTNENPLWQGPSGEGWNGGVTQSMISRFLSCRERFRLKYILGLDPHDKWNHRLGYGNMWHVCEEALARGVPIQDYSEPRLGAEDVIDLLTLHTSEMCRQYPLQVDEIFKWYNVCKVQFPEYVKYWQEHPDVKNRTPLSQEQTFDVPYTLPSGRIVRLRGKRDAVDLIDEGIYIQENKTKGDIDKLQIERQLRFDLQTMMYLIALQSDKNPEFPPPFRTVGYPILGVRYNVVRRPLSGGKGTIRPHIAKQNKAKGTYTPAETDTEFYERLRRDYLADEPDYWFFRVRGEVSQHDIQVFKDTCFNPLLETICDWYSSIVGEISKFATTNRLHYRTPFGVYSALEEGGATEYDAFLETGSEAGLRRVTELFLELK